MSAASGRPAQLASGFLGLGTELFVDSALDDVIERLRVDTAVLLVVDPTETRLVATASRGLEEEGLQGFQLPIGTGFSGRIAAERQPMMLDEIRPGAVVNPLIPARGVRSIAGVPLLARGTLIGVLHVGSLQPRRFTTDEIVVLSELGADLAERLYVERALADRTAARALQCSLVPAAPPNVDGLEIATRFIPASTTALGGDWYDVFVLPDGSAGLVMGGVAGSGLRAAVVMGRLRSALRAYALESPTPGDAIDRLNRKLLHFEPGEMATVLFMVISPERDAVSVASAGHVAPLVAQPDAPAVFVDCDPSPPIGTSFLRPTCTRVVPLGVGSVIACCTDGLFERRRRPLGEQLERLRRAVRAGSPETVCNDVIGDGRSRTPRRRHGIAGGQASLMSTSIRVR